MALGKKIGEYVLKAMSVRQTEAGGDRRHLEIDMAGESTGEVTG
jgi:hypothetical protein